MAHRFATAEWARALQEEINGSSEYRNAAAKWGVEFNGNMLLAFEADATWDRPVNLFIRLEQGRCAGAEFVAEAAGVDAGFVLRGPFTLWKEVLDRKTMAATAIMSGKMQVEGNKMTLLKHTAASRALVHCTASVDTDWDS